MWGSGRKNGAMAMRVLIIACDPDLGLIWGRHLRRRGAEVTVAPTQMKVQSRPYANRTHAVLIVDGRLALDAQAGDPDKPSWRCRHDRPS